MLSEFLGVLELLGLDCRVIGTQLFDTFDQDSSGQLDLKEVYIGMALLLATSMKECLECAFAMMARQRSEFVSQEEVQVFIGTIAPATVPREELRALTLIGADTSRGGVSFQEFVQWALQEVVAGWVEKYQHRILARYKFLGGRDSHAEAAKQPNTGANMQAASLLMHVHEEHRAYWHHCTLTQLVAQEPAQRISREKRRVGEQDTRSGGVYKVEGLNDGSLRCRWWRRS